MGVYEEKYDGWRLVAYNDRRRVRLLSRRGVDPTRRFAEIAKQLPTCPRRRSFSTGSCAFDQGYAHFSAAADLRPFRAFANDSSCLLTV